MPLRVTQVQARDILGVRELALSPGKVTLIKGRNGSGKTSHLRALQAVLGGRVGLASLARVTAEGEPAAEPEAVIVLEGDGKEYRVKRDAKGVTVKQRIGDSAAFGDVAQPQAFLASLQDGQAANPVAFLTAADKDRVILLLEALDLQIDRTVLRQILGAEAALVRPQPKGLNALEELAAVHTDIYTARTGVNVDAKGKSSSAEQLRREAPAKIPDAPTEEDEAKAATEAEALAVTIARREAEITAANEAVVAESSARGDREEQAIRAGLKASVAAHRAAHEKRAAALRAEVERKIAELAAVVERDSTAKTAQAQAELDAITARQGDEFKAARAAADAARAELATEREGLAATRTRLAGMRQQREHAGAARALHAQIDRFERDADELKARSQRLSEVLGLIEGYRSRLASELPVPGLEIAGNEIRVNGVPFDQLNTAQRVAIAVKVSLLRARGRDLPVVFVDGAEALDAENFEALCAALEAAEAQAFVARVTEDEALVTATRGAA